MHNFCKYNLMFYNYFARFIISDVSSLKILFLKILFKFVIYFIKRFCEVLFMFTCTLLLYINAIIDNNSN